MLILTDDNFKKEIENSEKPVLIDFWSARCFPCHTLSPILEKLAEEYKDKIIFAKLNVDKAPITAREYEIDRIPIVLFIKGNKVISGFVGAQPEEFIREWLDKTYGEC